MGFAKLVGSGYPSTLLDFGWDKNQTNM